MEQLARVEENQNSSEVNSRSIFFADGFLEYNARRWNLDVIKQRFTTGDKEVPYLDVATYVDKKGRITMAPWVSYMAICFQPSPTDRKYRVNSQWVNLAGQLVKEMRARGLAGPIVLPFEVEDVRPWQWAGFNVGVRYTYVADLPFSLSNADPDVRRQIKRAEEAGYMCSRTTDMKQVVECLGSAEQRQDFDLQLTADNLDDIRRLMGDEAFRIYGCFTSASEMISAYIVLYAHGEPAIGWIGGTKAEHLRTGATQLIYQAMIEDLGRAGARALDFTGANIPGVSQAKSKWGCRLVPYYVIEDYNTESLTRWLKKWIKQKLSSREE